MRTLTVVLLAAGLTTWSSGQITVPATVETQAAAPSATVTAIHELLTGYWKGDFEVVARRFSSGRQIDALLPSARTWVETSQAREWEFGSPVLFLELADAALRLPGPSSATAVELVRLGFRQLTDHRGESKEANSISSLVEMQWHRAALAVLQGAGAWQEQETYLKDVERRRLKEPSGRIPLAAGIAIEQRVASAERLADVDQGKRTASERERALEGAVREYDRAAPDPEVLAEASARAAAVYLRLGRHRDALGRLDLAGGSTEVLLDAWLEHLRGQALEGLGQADPDASLERAQSLTHGLTDPWREFDRGDFRLLPQWIARLKGEVATTMADPKTSRMPAAVIVDRYAHGEFDIVAATLQEAGSLRRFLEPFAAAVYPRPKDLALISPNELERRRNVAAAVALEAAQARGLVEWGESQKLLEFVCGWFRTLGGPPTEFERLWYVATAALMEGQIAGTALARHMDHALNRFPDEPDLMLARGVAAELRTGQDPRTPRGLGIASFSLLATARSRLTDALRFDATRPEAHLRLGSIALRWGKPKEAIDHLSAAVDHATDPYVVYLAHVFSGRAYSLVGRWQEAVTSYTAATAIVPTQTARLGLVTALSHVGEYAAASALADRTLLEPSPPNDPWLFYGQGDFRNWISRRDAVRRALQR